MASSSSSSKNPATKLVRKTKLRESITPGTVLILLSGRFKGKRVVFLKQLGSGLLLVSGPFKINGVPLRRVNQAYVIATSTKVDIDGVNVSKFDDAYFRASIDQKKKKNADTFFDDGKKKEKSVVPDERKADQKEVDAGLIAAIKGVPQLKAYLGSIFRLRKGQYPHNMKF
eukprot:CAMPEP_0201545862 /NCGR_PEP_ID=MMETSP0173_2-20130828/2276_1 /ASSEMBLY_ACC=CAM_ASM_000268 /TAXON_ID=218659 /ORGANISM="Vexillifera sp., Strain DIVA3 564/2" /LENGTH=170 /DNA_ID=CAMNT_0047954389 /DNA_START=36 /DNA_END=548 /DNA_ORIENTATION=-